jgi:hypothetical protein
LRLPGHVAPWKKANMDITALSMLNSSAVDRRTHYSNSESEYVALLLDQVRRQTNEAQRSGIMPLYWPPRPSSLRTV